MDRYSFLVRLFHPLLHTGLSRRTNIAIALNGGVLSANAVNNTNYADGGPHTMRMPRLLRVFTNSIRFC